jgi:hypothetical protein
MPMDYGDCNAGATHDMTFDAEWRDKYADKLEEARYFLSRMRSESQEPTPWPFTYDLRAFVSAARSAVDYAQTEAKAQDRAREYYGLHDASEVRTFFRGLRNDNLHVAPVHPSKSVHAGVTLVAHLGSTDDTRNEIVRAEASPTTRVVTYTFAAWQGQGSGEVQDSCERYLRDIETLLAELVAAGIIVR